MPEKLLTLQELSEYLGIKEECLRRLADQGAISAYRIGGELLRFRKDQIDAISSEIDSRITEDDRLVVSEARKKVKERARSLTGTSRSSTQDKVADFFYFNDFYLVSAVVILILLIVIVQG